MKEQLSLPLKSILHIENLEYQCANNKAVYHKRCRMRYDDLHYERAVIRAKKTEFVEDRAGSSMRTRFQFEERNFSEDLLHM